METWLRVLPRLAQGEAVRLRREAHDAALQFSTIQYDLGSPSTCSAKKLRIKFVEIGAT